MENKIALVEAVRPIEILVVDGGDYIPIGRRIWVWVEDANWLIQKGYCKEIPTRNKKGKYSRKYLYGLGIMEREEPGNGNGQQTIGFYGTPIKQLSNEAKDHLRTGTYSIVGSIAQMYLQENRLPKTPQDIRAVLTKEISEKMLKVFTTFEEVSGLDRQELVSYMLELWEEIIPTFIQLRFVKTFTYGCGNSEQAGATLYEYDQEKIDYLVTQGMAEVVE